MIRKDVYRYAAELGAQAGMNTDSVYYWLMMVLRSGQYTFTDVKAAVRVSDGRIILDDDNYITNRMTYHNAPYHVEDGGIDWEDLILERQEQWMD